MQMTGTYRLLIEARGEVSLGELLAIHAPPARVGDYLISRAGKTLLWEHHLRGRRRRAFRRRLARAIWSRA